MSDCTDVAALERRERLIERATPRSHERDLVDDERRPRQRLLAGDRRLSTIVPRGRTSFSAVGSPTRAGAVNDDVERALVERFR
jgi:hypothetical protein